MKLRELIRTSLFKGSKPSSSRIMAYVMMLIIFLCGITAIGIEIGNAVIAWKANTAHVIPSSHVIIIGMWLAHQLTLLGIYKRAETNIKKVDGSFNIKPLGEDEGPSDAGNV